MRKIGIIAAATLAAMGVTLVQPGEEVEPTPKPKPKGRIRQYFERRPGPAVSAAINRHTGKPHEHKREIARRQRQEARLIVRKYRERFPQHLRTFEQVIDFETNSRAPLLSKPAGAVEWG